MSYELFMTEFDRPEAAHEARESIAQYRRTEDLAVLDMAVLATRRDGSAVVQHVGHPRPRGGAAVGAVAGSALGVVAGGVLGAIGGPEGSLLGAAIGASAGALAAGMEHAGFAPHDLREMQAALTPGTSALAALVAPAWAGAYAKFIAECGGDTTRATVLSDSDVQFQPAKRAFIARLAARRRAQVAAWTSTTAEDAAALTALNGELARLYADVKMAPPAAQLDRVAHAAALRARRNALRHALNQTLLAEIARLDRALEPLEEALAKVDGGEPTAIAADVHTLRAEHALARTHLARSRDDAIEEQARDMTALQEIATAASGDARAAAERQLTGMREA